VASLLADIAGQYEETPESKAAGIPVYVEAKHLTLVPGHDSPDRRWAVYNNKVNNVYIYTLFYTIVHIQ
jgi:hypothetical protein